MNSKSTPHPRNRVILDTKSSERWIFLCSWVVIFCAALAQDGPLPIAESLIFALLFLVITIRVGYVVNRGEKTLERWWRCCRIVPLFRVGRWKISDFQCVYLLPKVISDSDGETTIYEVNLIGAQHRTLVEFHRYLPAKVFAKNAAHTLQLPLNEQVDNVLVWHRPSEIGTTLTETLTRNDPCTPTAPSSARVRVTRSEGGNAIELMATPTSVDRIVLSQFLLGGCVVAGFVFNVWWLIVIGLYAGSLFLRRGIASHYPLVISVSGGLIYFKRKCLLSGKVSLKDLEEIVLTANCLFLISDDRRFAVPYFFGGDEGQAMGAFVRDFLHVEISRKSPTTKAPASS